jgi:hypothetical protein
MNLDESVEQYINADRTLSDLYARFGRVVLIPDSNDGDDIPARAKDLRNITFEQTQNVAHLRDLSRSSISVVCGAASGNLCALRFRSESGRQDFIDGNPALAGALTTQAEGAFIIWVRFTGFCPKSVKLDDNLTFLSHRQSVQVFERDVFKDPIVMRGSNPSETDCFKVEWPYEPLRYFLFEFANAVYGEPIIVARNGSGRPNHTFLAFLFGKERGLQFDPNRRAFFRKDGETWLWERLDKPMIMQDLTHYLLDQGRTRNIPALQTPMGRSELEEILRHMEIMVVGQVDAGTDSLDVFLGANVEYADGADVTTDELWNAYRAFCQNHKLNGYAGREFHIQLGKRMTSRFSVSQAHSLRRDGTARRGYLNLRLMPLRTERTERTAQFA